MNKPTSAAAAIGLLILTPLIVVWALLLSALGRERLLRDIEYTLWGFE